MPEFELGTFNFESYCSSCGEHMCNRTDVTTTKNRGTPCVRIEACPACLRNAEEEGYNKGYADAKAKFEES